MYVYRSAAKAVGKQYFDQLKSAIGTGSDKIRMNMTNKIFLKI